MQSTTPFKFPLTWIVVVLMMASGFGAQAQKRNNIWTFGDGSGLNFNTDPVVPFVSKAEGTSIPYYMASICDKEGRLLFYTDGIKLWNSYGALLPRYRNWWPWSDKVMPLICPYPDNDSLYYLFGISDQYNANNLIYLTIKMYKSGDVEEAVHPRPTDAASYYTKLTSNAAVLLAGTHHCNGKDMWITTYSPGVLKSFLITGTGVRNTPVTTPVPDAVIPARKIEGGNSNIKFSANGEKLVVPVLEGSRIVVYDFDKAAGTFSNPVSLHLPEGYTLEDVELSPDASKLYAGAFKIIDPETAAELHYIFQYDLHAGNAEQIENTRYALNSGDRAACSPRGSCTYIHRTLQLGPDGRIYISTNELTNAELGKAVNVIENPDNAGRDCFYRSKWVDLKKKYRFINYNYIRSSNFTLRENAVRVQKKTCADRPVTFSLLFSHVDSVKWNFGDSASGLDNVSTLLAPEHKYPGPGTYRVKAIVYNNCLTDTTEKEITVETDLAVKVPAAIQDTTLCVGGDLALDATAPFAKFYVWENGLIYARRTIAAAGRYLVTVSNDCSSDTKEFTVVQSPCDCNVFIPSAFTPNNDGLNDRFKPVVKCLAKDYSLKIFSRNGDVVFQSSEPGREWDGKIRQAEPATGMYVWLIRYRNPNTNEVYTRHGTVMLVR